MNTRFKLVQVHALLRHGDRSPSVTLDSNDISYECGMIDGDRKWLSLNDFRIKPNPEGAKLRFLTTKLFRGFESQKCLEFQLTLKGFRQHYATGAFIRDRYMHLVQGPVKPSDILIQCTNYRRTIHSSASFALGFLPSDSIFRNQVPLHTTFGSMLATPPPGRGIVYDVCKNVFQLKAKELQESGYANRMFRLRPFFAMIAKSMNLNTKGLDADDIFDNVWGIVCHDLPLPCQNGVCLNDTMIAKGMKMVDWSFSHKYPVGSSVLSMQPFMFHSLIREIDIAIENRKYEKNERGRNEPFKFLFNFAHDSTLTAFLVSLGYQIDTWLPYASRIVIELWEDSLMPGHYYIRFLLNGRSITKQLIDQYPRDVQVELNKELVSYQSWKSIMVTGAYRDIKDYNNKCNLVKNYDQ